MIQLSLREETRMSDLFWLTNEQIERLRPFFPKSHGKPRVRLGGMLGTARWPSIRSRTRLVS